MMGLPLFSAGKPHAHHITNLGSEQGLSETHVFAMIQDKMGFLWFGTRDGLNRYDGYDFKIFRNDPSDPLSLSNNYIYSLYEDLDGIIWVGTRGGLNRFDQTTETFVSYRHVREDKTSLIHDIVHAILPAKGIYAGKMWIGTGGGLALFDPDSGAFQRFEGGREHGSLTSQTIRSLASHEDGSVWVGAENGLFLMRSDSPGQFESFFNDPNDPKSISNSKITALYLEQDNRLWIGHGLGVDTLDTAAMSGFEKIRNKEGDPLGSTMVLSPDAGGHLWIGSNNQGLIQHHLASGGYISWGKEPRMAEAMGQSGLISFLEGQNGGLWFGSYGDGVIHLVPVPFSHEGDPDVNVATLVKGKDQTLWVGYRRDGLERRSPDGTITRYLENGPEGLVENAITAMTEDSKGRLWFGHENRGLSYYDPSDNRFKMYRDDTDPTMNIGWVGSLMETPDGKIWVGSDDGLKSVDAYGDAKTEIYLPDPTDPQSISGPSVPCLHVSNADSKQTLWIGTWTGGLNRMDLDQPGVFKHYKNVPGDPTSLSTNGVASIYEDEDGFLWIGGIDGFNRFDPRTGTAKSWLIKHGLPSNTIYRVQAERSGKLWLSTPRGLARFDPKTETFQAYDRFDGLQIDDFRENCGFVEPDGRQVFGGSGGWISFDPKQIVTDPIAPKAVITQLTLDHTEVELKRRDPKSPLTKSITQTDEVVLDHRSFSLELLISALHFTSPQENRLSWKLENFEPEWHESNASKRLAVYTNLGPGEYIFRVKAANKDGIWGDETTLKIRKKPMPWQTWWAKTLYVLAALSLVGSYIHSVNQKLQAQKLEIEHMQHVEQLKDAFNLELEQKVEERTRELKGARKKLLQAARAEGMAEIASEVLHNVGNRLNGVRTSIHLIQEKLDERKWLELLKRIAELVRGNEDKLEEVFGDTLKARMLPETLNRIHTEMARSQEEITVESDMLFERVEDIVQSLRKQQEHVVARDLVIEPADLHEIIREAIDEAADLLANVDCHVHQRILPKICIDRLKSLRMLSFLIQNAVDAIEEQHGEQIGRIDFLMGVNGGVVELDIKDNGAGIREEEVTRLFSHGFSTKTGREGFGLHYSANAMKEMEGGIKVTSPGLGLGAIVTLTFKIC